MRIAVDFDGTIVEHRYPEIGKPVLFAFDALKELQKRGHSIILWTYRSGKELDEAVKFCAQKGFEFYSVNKSFPEEKFEESTTSRKINADLFIDDRNIGGFPGWATVLRILHPEDFEMSPEPKSLKEKFRNFVDELKS